MAIKAKNIYELAAKIPGWRFDPAVSEKNECRMFRLDYAGHTALASRHTCPKRGPGWAIQIIGQPMYHYSDRMTLGEITADVRADIEKLAPVVVIETPANVTEDLVANLPDTGYEQIDNGGLVAGVDY